MLFDPSLDVLSDHQERHRLSCYFSEPLHCPVGDRNLELASQPILHTSYEFFLIIADATKVARISRPLAESEMKIWKRLEQQLSRLAPHICSDLSPSQLLYFYALQILLLKSHPGSSPHQTDKEVAVCLREAIELIPNVDPDKHFTSFLLWPLAILGSVATSTYEARKIRDSVLILDTKRSGGQAKWVLKRLEDIWSTNYSAAPGHPSWRCLGLQSLLDGYKDVR